MTLLGEVRALSRRLWWLILVAPVALLPAIAALFIKLVRTNQNMGVVVVGLLGVIVVALVIEMIRKSRRLPSTPPPRPRKTIEPLLPAPCPGDQRIAA
jgi:zinc transporter ZupT